MTKNIKKSATAIRKRFR